MEYRVLGPLEVRDGERSLPLAGAKQRALLALLLLNAGRVVSRDRLIDELWGDEPPETAVTIVQVYVSRLRKLLPPDALVTRPPGYLLRAEAEQIDLQRFERLVADARKAEPERRRSSCCARRSRCGAGRRLPSSENRSPGSRAAGSTTCDSRRSRSASRRTLRSAATPS